MNPDFCRIALEEFTGCDTGNIQAGSPENPSIWVFGLEHGTYKSINDENEDTRQKTVDENYSVEMQMKWPYNRGVFKLLASMHPEYGFDAYDKFVSDFRPFEKDSEGFFKGNLYPFPCRKISVWSEKAINHTGAATKAEYQDWCRMNRLPAIKAWVKKHSPKVFIGVGITHRDEFSQAVFGRKVDLQIHEITVNGYRKRCFYYKEDGKNLVVIPHFSGCYGLNSNESIRKAGEFISDFID